MAMSKFLPIEKSQVIQITVYEKDNFTNDKMCNNHIEDCGFNLEKSDYYLLKTMRRQQRHKAGTSNNNINVDDFESDYDSIDPTTNRYLDKLFNLTNHSYHDSDHIPTLTIGNWTYRLLMIDRNKLFQKTDYNELDNKERFSDSTYDSPDHFESLTDDSDEYNATVYKITRKFKHVRVYHKLVDNNPFCIHNQTNQHDITDDYDYKEKWYEYGSDRLDSDDEIIEEDIYEEDCHEKEQYKQDYDTYSKLQNKEIVYTSDEFDTCEDDNE
ncbi:hypothetical protein Smp_163520 [Schistosoma mansoni]|uniref:RNA polymerase II nuclear localization protein SLC7A6OS n=1 Tax=Schistosoma mansoni TaxID=6183 RepID=G4LXE1_SCHMA|nr:hypothetical protein Smp_163520 [Schistosoma mansoni]|eukprot:XP_018645930.1 hypothetical protein Smp_163520 [Schistosoma mansoni]